MENLRSNVTLKSNIYNRADVTVGEDTAFVRAVRGRKALRLLTDTTGAELTPVQKRVLEGTGLCRIAVTETADDTADTAPDVAFGTVLRDGEIQLSCRCERSGCKHYAKCMEAENAAAIERGGIEYGGAAATDEPESEIEFLSDNYVAAAETDDTAADIVTETDDTAADVAAETDDTAADAVTETDDTAADVVTETDDTAVGVVTETDDTATDVVTAESALLDLIGNAGDKRIAVIFDKAAEVEYAADLLYRNGIAYSDKTRAPKAGRLFAELFWDFAQASISEDMFADRVFGRVADEDYEALKKELVKNGIINLDYWRGRIEGGLIPKILRADRGTRISIGTFSSYGITFDTDIIVFATSRSRADIDDFTETKRVPKDVTVECIGEINAVGYTLKRGRICRDDPESNSCRVLLGFDGDLVPSGFLADRVSGDHPDDVLARQCAIASLKRGDPLTVRFVNGVYNIVSGDNAVGVVSDTAAAVINDLKNNSSEPTREPQLRVQNVYTVIANDGRLWYSASKTWYGLEITGSV